MIFCDQPTHSFINLIDSWLETEIYTIEFISKIKCTTNNINNEVLGCINSII